jgi:hypothetical protein
MDYREKTESLFEKIYWDEHERKDAIFRQSTVLVGIISLALSANLFLLRQVGYGNIVIDLTYWIAPLRGLATIFCALSVVIAFLSVGFASYAIVGPKYSYMPRLKGLLEYLQNLKEYYRSENIDSPENEAYSAFWRDLESKLADATEFNRNANRRRSAARVWAAFLAAGAAGMTTTAGVLMVADELLYQYQAMWRSSF